MRKSHKIRPVLESLESIALLSAMPGHATRHTALHAVSRQPTASIQPIFPPNYAVTGVRQDSGGNVAITLTAKLSSTITQAYVYYGPLSSTSNPAYLHLFSPTFQGETVTASQFYGPNTPKYDPSIGAGNITVVGSYVHNGSSYQNGMMYKGPLDGSGQYTKIDAPGNGKEKVADTIAHSTMGNLVVGNFDYQGHQAHGHGFIFDGTNFTTVDIGRFSTTIYGIWQNGGASSTNYTIVGGFSNVVNGGKAFIENYNAAAPPGADPYSNFKSFSFNNRPTLETHFEGISAFTVNGINGFSIAATETSLRHVVGASYAFIPVNGDGSFGTASWVPMQNTVNRKFTTGNTVIDSSVMGVFPLGRRGGGGFSSYISTVE
jgi:hypothetical protein